MEDDLQEVIQNHIRTKKDKDEALIYWKDYLVTDLINDAVPDEYFEDD